jgi:hypothetical protein
MLVITSSLNFMHLNLIFLLEFHSVNYNELFTNNEYQD